MMIRQTYYISTGSKNAMYTLRSVRETDILGKRAFFDNYITNLAATLEKATQKAVEYVDAFRERVGETDDFKILLDTDPEYEVDARRGKLSIEDTRKIETIEQGIFPFGKHSGTKIVDAPESYILYFADMLKKDNLDAVITTLATTCLGIALERGYIAKREERRAEQAELDAQSNFIGKEGERLVFEGTIITSYEKFDEYNCSSYWINKVRCGLNIVTYVGNKSFGKKDEAVKFKATVKKHDTYQGVKSTKVNRPTMM